ncbi:hypothetical protein [Streptomyces sp. CNQ085]|nr:hypothetical protein [Streptomyces sp. CNQ085]MCI0384316.1 hypothetical protein [Streptomyces sp. CNQ085]
MWYFDSRTEIAASARLIDSRANSREVWYEASWGRGVCWTMMACSYC